MTVTVWFLCIMGLVLFGLAFAAASTKEAGSGVLVLAATSMASVFIFAAIVEYQAVERVESRARYCTAEPSTRADTVVYLRANPECVVVVLNEPSATP